VKKRGNRSTSGVKFAKERESICDNLIAESRRAEPRETLVEVRAHLSAEAEAERLALEEAMAVQPQSLDR